MSIDAHRPMPLTRAGPLCWRAGLGWLILAGGGSWSANETGDVDAAALGWADLDRPLAVLPAAGTSTHEADALLDYYADLGGPNGYVVPIFDPGAAHQRENCSLLEEAGLIYLSDGPDALGLVRALRMSPALEAIARAFEGGAAIVAMGAAAAALGDWVCDPDRDVDPQPQARPEPGFGWLPNVIIAPRFKGTEVAHQLRRLLALKPNCIGLGIPQQTALCLGPTGGVENVGPGQVTVVVSGLEVEA